MTDKKKSPFDPEDNATDPTGMRKGLTSYGDQGFSLFLRKAFIKGAGFTDAALDRPVIGIHAVDLVWGFGSLHCLTQQQPAAA